MTAPVRIVLIGAGLIGQRHGREVLTSDETELVGIVDPHCEAQDWPVPVWDTPDKVPADTADAAIIATPTGTHLDIALSCVARGWAALIEKPITDDVATAQQLSQAFEDACLPLLVGHHRRYHDCVTIARRLLRDGAIGTPLLLSALWSVRKPDGYFDAGRWRLGADGGPVMINLIHEIDMMRHLFGEIVETAVLGSNAERQGPVEDSAAISLRFDSGMLGTIAMSDAALSPWSFEAASAENPNIATSGQHCWRISGTAGALEFPNLRLWAGPQEADWSHVLNHEAIASKPTVPLQAQLAHFAALVRGEETKARVSGRDATQSLAATLSIAQACRQKFPQTQGSRYVSA